MKTKALTVELADRSYPIHLNGARDALKETVTNLCEAEYNVCVITDTTLQAAQPNFLAEIGFDANEVLALPSGEQTKSIEYFSEALRFLTQKTFNRDSKLFAFGGGVIGDLAGYVAASYLRGIDFYQIPTTLLSMVDSSVGGKTGINLPEGKNLAGAFWQPKAVFIDTDILQTLPEREFAAGMAEVIKYGMLYDTQLFTDLENYHRFDANSPELPEIIRRCCTIKAQIVADDEQETAVSGGRALLNLGHTFAHAIENVAGYGHYLHGEAVGIGLNLATQLSVQLGRMSTTHIERVNTVLEKYKLPNTLKNPLPIDQLMATMKRDKKNRSGQLCFVTMETLGKAVTTEDIDTKLIETILKATGAV